MSVPTRYILAAIAFAVAAIGFLLLPVDASAECNGCQRPQPPACHGGCNQPPPSHHCNRCTPPTIIVPPPNVPPPNIVVVNAGARASAQASATAIAIANANTGDTIIHQNMVVTGNTSVAVTNSAFAVTGVDVQTETVARERQLLIQAICMDAGGNPHPASQTFGGRDVATAYRGEIYRCMAGTRMRATVDGRSFDCAEGEALWYENGNATCRPQIARRPCNERSLLRRFGAGDKMALIRDTETRQARSETTFNGAMTMDGGVGQGVW